MSSDCEVTVKNVIERYQMLSRGDTAIVGLSGGADSVALVSILDSLKTEYNLRIIAAHVNHGLRGAEAKRDEDFAKSICDKLGIEFRVLHANVPLLAKESGVSFETCGRNVRYDFFKNIALEMSEKYYDSDISRVKIATAHNACDCAETLLLNLSRGTGLSGLLSIPPVRYLDDTQIKIIRPIIELEREKIESYLSSKSLEFMTDSTNLIPDCSRNIIRLNVLPELECINRGSIANIVRCIDTLRQDEEYLNSVANKALESARISKTEYSIAELKKLERPILARVLYKIVDSFCGIKPEKVHLDLLESIICQGNGKVQITGGIFAELRGEELELYMKKAVQVADNFCIEIPHNCNEFEACTPFSKVTLKIYENDDKKPNNDFPNALDYGKMNGNFILRNRRSGDKFCLPKRKVTKSLKNLFNEMKIETDKRQSLSILEVDGEIAYIEGVGPSSKYIATEKTTTFLIIEISGR